MGSSRGREIGSILSQRRMPPSASIAVESGEALTSWPWTVSERREPPLREVPGTEGSAAGEEAPGPARAAHGAGDTRPGGAASGAERRRHRAGPGDPRAATSRGPARGSDPGPAALALPSAPAAAALRRPSLGRGGPGAGVRRGELGAAPAAQRSAPGPPSGSRPPSLLPLPSRAARRPGGSAALSGRNISPTPAASPAFPQPQPSLPSCRVPARPWMQRRGAAGENPDWALSRSRLLRCDQRSGCPARARFYSNFRGSVGPLAFFEFVFWIFFFFLEFRFFFPQILKLSNVFKGLHGGGVEAQNLIHPHGGPIHC